jgi:hypothetical protein
MKLKHEVTCHWECDICGRLHTFKDLTYIFHRNRITIWRHLKKHGIKPTHIIGNKKLFGDLTFNRLGFKSFIGTGFFDDLTFNKTGLK